MKKFNFKKKKVLVTGATGSIGSEVVRELLKKNCKVIRAFSNDEDSIYSLSEKFSKNNFLSKKNIITHMRKNRVRYFVGDIRDFNRCLESTRGIDVVIHAAAMKHVPICEYNKKETYKTNVIGTKNLIKASLANKVKKFLLISTDKSVYPTSYMGLTKKLAEKLVLNQIKKNRNKCKFSIIRFGNVIGSRGSVLLKFISQIRNNEKITVTHKSMTRFFITIESAVKHILESILMMQGGEVFIIKKLKAFKIIDLAYALKKIYKSRSKVIEFKPRDGEKLFEQMLYKNESNQLQKKGNLFFLNKRLHKKNRTPKTSNYIYNELNSKFAKCLDQDQIIYFLKKNRLLKF